MQSIDSKHWYISDDEMYMSSFWIFTGLRMYLNVVAWSAFLNDTSPNIWPVKLLCTFHPTVMAWSVLTRQSATIPVVILTKLVSSAWQKGLCWWRKSLNLYRSSWSCLRPKSCVYAAQTRCPFEPESVCVVHQNTVPQYVLKAATSYRLSLYE